MLEPNSRKRVKQDLAYLASPDAISLADYGITEPPRIIRSHRAPNTFPLMRYTFSLVLLLFAAGWVLYIIPIQDTESSTTLSAPMLPKIEPAVVHKPILLASDNLLAHKEATRDVRMVRVSREAERKPRPIERVISYALAQRGDPYVWAASGPDAFDCSGLVLRAFNQVGVNLPHYTGSIIKLGTRVSYDNLKRGDIVFPTSGHVGIYLGEGKFIHASSGQSRVVVTDLYSFYAARRITV